MSSDPGSVMARLDALSQELDHVSKELAKTEEEVEPIEAQYEERVTDWETALWDQCREDPETQKWPPEKLRTRMAHKAFDAVLLAQMTALQAKRKRLEKRVGSIKVQVDAQRSILSALKTEAEATR